MNYKLDLKHVLLLLNISAEELADNLHISYCDMAAMLRGDIPIADNLIGQLYRLYGASIFF